MAYPHRSAGFSLTELLVVIAIIAIVSAIAIPYGLSYVRNYEVIGAAQNVASQVQLARAQAVRRNVRRGLLLNFDYPETGQYQFTTLEEDPVNGDWDGGIYPENPGPFDPNNRDYGTAPVPPDNRASPGPGLPSPHGPVVLLPMEMQFVCTQAFTSLLFQQDGSVEAVSAQNVGSSCISQSDDGLNWVVKVIHPRYGLTRTVTVSRNGRVVITNP